MFGWGVQRLGGWSFRGGGLLYCSLGRQTTCTPIPETWEALPWPQAHPCFIEPFGGVPGSKQVPAPLSQAASEVPPALLDLLPDPTLSPICPHD